MEGGEHEVVGEAEEDREEDAGEGEGQGGAQKPQKNHSRLKISAKLFQKRPVSELFERANYREISLN